jgi:probable phosphoglycerate mutase
MILTRLIVVRHGETVWNFEDKLQGQMDSELTPLGIAQSQALAERLARCPIASLYSSDLGRARQTAECIAARTGHEIRFESRLRERHLGIFQGRTWAEVQDLFPEDMARFLSNEVDYLVPEGESYNQSSSRIVSCLEELARAHAGQQIGIVSHGAVLGAVLRHVLGISPKTPRRFRRLNGSWNAFTFDNGEWFLETWGDVSHLQSA